MDLNKLLVCRLSLALPLIVSCMANSADGPSGPEQRELSTLASTSLTALAKRSPNEFKAAVAAFKDATLGSVLFSRASRSSCSARFRRLACRGDTSEEEH